MSVCIPGQPGFMMSMVSMVSMVSYSELTYFFSADLRGGGGNAGVPITAEQVRDAGWPVLAGVCVCTAPIGVQGGRGVTALDSTTGILSKKENRIRNAYKDATLK